MSLEDLQEAGVLLPEEEWGERALESTASRAGYAVTGIVAIACGALMFTGDGGTTTWIAAGAFLLDLLAFTWLSWRAVDRQKRRRRPAPGGPGSRG